MVRHLLFVLLFVSFFGNVRAIDNGIGTRPPRGWRSWNQFQCAINQSMIEDQYRAQVRKRDGGKSLLDLGYVTSGIDDCWQKCGSGVEGGYHNGSGYPIVDESLFPDMRAMTSFAKSLGLRPGWYGNNCRCKETSSFCDPAEGDDVCFRGDVRATIDYGFQSIKLDGCGITKNVTLYAELLNETGVPVMIENCHNGNPTYPTRDEAIGTVDCPMNFFRSSTDVRPTFGSILINLESTSAYNGQNLTGPGCYAYPDMLEVGVTNAQRSQCTAFGQAGCTLNLVEAQTHFSAWSIVSAPLVLGCDLTDESIMSAIWPIISNEEVIAVNEAWVGDSGVLAKQSSENISMQNCSWFNDDGCEHPKWMVWKKHLPRGKVAVLLMNNDDSVGTVRVDFEDIGVTCPSSGCNVRDIVGHEDLGRFKASFEAADIPSHGSFFGVVG